jgi:hypothetical protein
VAAIAKTIDPLLIFAKDVPSRFDKPRNLEGNHSNEYHIPTLIRITRYPRWKEMQRTSWGRRAASGLCGLGVILLLFGWRFSDEPPGAVASEWAGPAKWAGGVSLVLGLIVWFRPVRGRSPWVRDNEDA